MTNELGSQQGTLRIELLGGVRIQVDGRWLDPEAMGPPQALDLIKLLAVRNDQPVHRRSIASTFWPRIDSETSARRLSKVIYRARRLLEPKLEHGDESRFIEATSTIVGLRAPVALTVDFEEFRKLCADARASRDPRVHKDALRRYRGNLLPMDTGAPWATSLRDRVRRAYVQLAMKAALLLLEARAPGEALQTIDEVLEHDPVNETAWIFATWIEAGMGNRAAGAARYARCAAIFRQRAGIDPPPAIGEILRAATPASLPALRAILPALPELPPEVRPGLDDRPEPAGTTETPVVVHLAQSAPFLESELFSQFARRHMAVTLSGEADAFAAARLAGAPAVSHISIARSNGRLKVRMLLYDASSSEQIADVHLEESEGNHAIVADALARAVRRRIDAGIVATAEAEAYVGDADRTRWFTAGRFFFHQRAYQPDAMRTAIACFRRALEVDPEFAPGRAALADALVLDEQFDIAAATASDALRTNPACVEALTSLAFSQQMINDRRFGEAERRLSEAIRLNPRYALARFSRAHNFIALGELDEAVREARFALELQPLSLMMRSGVGEALYYARRFDEARAVFEDVLRLDQTSVVPHYFLGCIALNRAEIAEAITRFRACHELSHHSAPLEALALVYASMGDHHAVDRTLRDLTTPPADVIASCLRGITIARLGRIDEGLVWIEQASSRRDEMVLYLRRDAVADFLRDEPGFRTLLDRIAPL